MFSQISSELTLRLRIFIPLKFQESTGWCFSTLGFSSRSLQSITVPATSSSQSLALSVDDLVTQSLESPQLSTLNRSWTSLGTAQSVLSNGMGKKKRSGNFVFLKPQAKFRNASFSNATICSSQNLHLTFIFFRNVTKPHGQISSLEQMKSQAKSFTTRVSPTTGCCIEASAYLHLLAHSNSLEDAATHNGAAQKEFSILPHGY